MFLIDHGLITQHLYLAYDQNINTNTHSILQHYSIQILYQFNFYFYPILFFISIFMPCLFHINLKLFIYIQLSIIQLKVKTTQTPILSLKNQLSPSHLCNQIPIHLGTHSSRPCTQVPISSWKMNITLVF